MWFPCPDGVMFPGCFSVQQEINKICVSFIAIESYSEGKQCRLLQKPTLTEQKMLDILDRLNLSR